jgi:hemerythrin-like domain-containing protein
MNVIGHLEEEHRTISNTMAVFEKEIKKIKEQKRVDPISINMSIDFIRTYTDLVHHGKEENILFRELEKKNLSADHSKIMKELLEEHKYSRSIIGKWMDATERYFDGEDTAQEIIGCLQELITFYPLHIMKENKHFFGPALDYFRPEELTKMMRDFEEFDDKVLHWKYRKVGSVLEERLENNRADISPLNSFPLNTPPL